MIVSRTLSVLFYGLLLLFQTSSGNFVYPASVTADDDAERLLPGQNKTRLQNYFAVEPADPAVVRGFPPSWRPGGGLDLPQCRRAVTNCGRVPHNVTSYLMSVDITLTYGETASLPSLPSAQAVVAFLQAAERMKYLNACWEKVQPVVFALAVPECVNGEMRRLIPLKKCREVGVACGKRVLDALPAALSLLRFCNDTHIFTNSTECEQETSWFDLLESNITFTCPFPLRRTKDSIKQTFSNGVCGLQCKNPFLPERQQEGLHVYVACLVAFSFVFNGAAFLSLVRRWRTLAKYPDQCMLFVNVCFLMSDIGWAIQFAPGARDLISCAEDGTERLNEPRSGENYGLCLVTFILIYYFMMAAALWFVTMSYCWFRSFRALYSSEVKVKGFLKNYSIRFHLLAWITPLLMTFIVVATSGIDSNNVTGVCFIGIRWGLVRGFLLIVPLILVSLVSGFFMVRGLILLYRLKTHKDRSLSASDKKNIQSTMLHIGFIAVVVCICIFTSVFIHIHYYVNQAYYAELRKQFIECHLANAIRGQTLNHCVPNISMDYETIELGVHLALQFVAGIIFSTWVWRHNQLHGWVKTIKRKLKHVSVVVTFRTNRSAASIPVTTTTVSGNDNLSFVPDTHHDTSPPSPSSVHIAVLEHSHNSNLYDLIDHASTGRSDYFRSRDVSPNPMPPVDSLLSSDGVSQSSVQEDRLQNWQNRAREIRSEHRKKYSTAGPSPYHRSSVSPNPIPPIDPSSDSVSVVTVEEDRLQNWQDRARKIRSEQRKKSSTTGPSPYHRSSSTGVILDSQDESVQVVMTAPSPVVPRQRRPGRVEFFRQGRPTPSPSRSVSQLDMMHYSPAEEYISFTPPPVEHGRLQVPSQPGRKISRIRAVSPLERAAKAGGDHRLDSPDEGIDLERLDGRGSSRDSLDEAAAPVVGAETKVTTTTDDDDDDGASSQLDQRPESVCDSSNA